MTTSKKNPERGYFRAIYSAIWDDPDFLSLTPEARLLFPYLRTCPAMNCAGIFVYYVEPMMKHTGQTREWIEAALGTLEERGWVRRSEGVLWVVNALRFDPSTPLSNKNNRQQVINTVRGLPRCSVVSQFIKYYGLMDELSEHYNPVGDPLPNPVRGVVPNKNKDKDNDKEKDKDKEKEKEKEKKDRTPPEGDGGANAQETDNGIRHWSDLPQEWKDQLEPYATRLDGLTGTDDNKPFKVFAWINGRLAHRPRIFHPKAILECLKAVEPNDKVGSYYKVLNSFLGAAQTRIENEEYKRESREGEHDIGTLLSRSVEG